MLALAEKLKEMDFSIAFAISKDQFWINRIEEMGYMAYKLSTGSAGINMILDIITHGSFSHLIYDTRNELSKVELEQIKITTGVVIVVIDTPEDTRLVADVALYPPLLQILEWNWNDFKGKLYSGWEYVLLRQEFLNKTNDQKKSTKKLLLSFGSTDPHQITEKTLKVISDYEYIFNGWDIIVLVGPQFNRLEAINKMLGFQTLSVQILQSPNNIANLFAEVELAIIAFGVTAYELASCQVPFFAISPTPDHEKSAKLFEDYKLGISLGQIEGFELRLVEAMINYTNLEAKTKTGNKFYEEHSICNYEKIIKAIMNYA
jgi:spore coat polysaccharide biosynthesis protein SpsF